MLPSVKRDGSIEDRLACSVRPFRSMKKPPLTAKPRTLAGTIGSDPTTERLAAREREQASISTGRHDISRRVGHFICQRTGVASVVGRSTTGKLRRRAPMASQGKPDGIVTVVTHSRPDGRVCCKAPVAADPAT